jgi:hypothetical protein
MSSWSLSSITSILQSAGITGSSLASAVSGLVGLSPNAKVKACLQAILANSANNAVVVDECKQIAEIANCPAAVMNLLPALQAATSPIAVVQIVQEMESVLGGSIFG